MAVRPMCPQGGTSDRIQKVSSVYAENMANAAYGATPFGTVLAKKLAPPVRPKEPPPPPMPEPVRGAIFHRFIFGPNGILHVLASPVLSKRTKLGIVLFLVVAVLSWVIPAGFGQVIGPLLGWSDMFYVLFIVAVFVLSIVGCCATCWSGLTNYDKLQMLHFEQVDMPAWVEKMDMFELGDLATWKEKKQKWEQLYYCYTHDCNCSERTFSGILTS